MFHIKALLHRLLRSTLIDEIDKYTGRVSEAKYDVIQGLSRLFGQMKDEYLNRYHEPTGLHDIFSGSRLLIQFPPHNLDTAPANLIGARLKGNDHYYHTTMSYYGLYV